MAGSIIAERLKLAAQKHYGKKHGVASDLARDLGVSPQSCSKWLRGITAPDESKWPILANLLGVSVEWLVGNTVERPVDIPRLDAEMADLIATSLDLVLPLTSKLKPDISPEQLRDVVLEVSGLVAEGREKTHIRGLIVDLLT